ncbi:calcineurin B homologous protein 1 [Drosophila tropicalis]|uniref:calcineurin B homologous protein 1 n=1 Tax=Drosophila tropicalis TaxID=46794 RepID=UPI0035AB955A
MGIRASRQLNPDQLAAYQHQYNLSSEQIYQLYNRFRSLDRYERGYLTPTDLLRIPQLIQNPLHRQIVDGFFPTRNSSERMDFGQFLGICSTFLVSGNGHINVHRTVDRAKKLRLLSQMFDTRCGGDCILRSDFREAMRSFLLSHLPNEKKHFPEMEAELDLLEDQAFGMGDEQIISYKQFERNLNTADVATRLSICKWLHKEGKGHAGQPYQADQANQNRRSGQN